MKKEHENALRRAVEIQELIHKQVYAVLCLAHEIQCMPAAVRTEFFDNDIAVAFHLKLAERYDGLSRKHGHWKAMEILIKKEGIVEKLDDYRISFRRHPDGQ